MPTTNFFEFFKMLFCKNSQKKSQKPDFSSFCACAGAGGELLRRQFDKNGVLTDALNAMPWNDQILLFSKAEKATAPTDHQCENMRVLGIKFKIRGVPEPPTVA